MPSNPAHRIRARFAWGGLSLPLFLLLACAPSPSPNGPSESLALVASLPPIATVVERVAGTGAEVFSILSPGDSPATHQVTDADVTRLARAAIYFRVGVPFESGPGLSALASMPSLQVVDLRQGIELRPMSPRSSAETGHARSARHEHAGRPDPHLWLSPRALVTVAGTVCSALCEAEPTTCTDFEARRDQLVTELEALDAELEVLLAPRAGSELYVFHPSWGYFAEAYGWTQVEIEIEGKMPSEAELARLARRMEASGARVLFTQPQLGGSSAAAAARALGVGLEVLDPLAPDVLENLRRVGRRIAEVSG